MADTDLHDRLNEALAFAAHACREDRIFSDLDAAKAFFKAERGTSAGLDMAERFTEVNQDTFLPEAYKLALEESTRHITGVDRWRALNAFCDLIEIGQKRDDLKPIAKVFMETAPELLEQALGTGKMAEAVWSAAARLIKVVQDVPREAALVDVAQLALNRDLLSEREEGFLVNHLDYLYDNAPKPLQALLEEPSLRAVEETLAQEPRWRANQLINLHQQAQQPATRRQSRGLLFRLLPLLMQEDVGYASEVAKLLFEDTGSDDTQRKEAIKLGAQAQMIGGLWETYERDWLMQVMAKHPDHVSVFAEGAQRGLEQLVQRGNGSADKQAILHRVTRLYEEVGKKVPEVGSLCLEWLTKVAVEDKRCGGELVARAFNWLGGQSKKHANIKRVLTPLTSSFNQLVARVDAVPLVGVYCTTETTAPLHSRLKGEIAKRLTSADDRPRQEMVVAILRSADPSFIRQIFGEGEEARRKRAEEIFRKPARTLTL